MKKLILNKVTVVVVSYNHEKFINSCIQSILSQTYKNIEIIVFDNNSTDSTHSILDQYENINNITIIRSNKNLGLCGGINEALKLATGEYITFFASDDIMVHNRISKQVEFLEKTPSAAGCFGNMLRINEDDSISSKGLLPEVDFQKWQLEDILYKRIQLYSPSQMYRTSIIKEEIQQFDTQIKIEDIWLYHKLLSKGHELYTLPYLFTFYRIHTSNTHTKYKMMMEEKIKILNEYINQPYYKRAKKFIYLEHFSNFGSTNKIEALKLLPKIFTEIRSKYLYIGLARLLFDWRK